MCYGQFSPIDPRCINFNKPLCFFCGVPNTEINGEPNLKWASQEYSAQHSKNCPMYLMWITSEKDSISQDEIARNRQALYNRIEALLSKESKEDEPSTTLL